MPHPRRFIPAARAAFLGLSALLLPGFLNAQPAVQDRPTATEQAGYQGVRRFGLAEPIARPQGALRLAAYNIENLFDDHDDPDLSGDQEDKHMTKPAAHREAAARAIRLIDADILCLQEVESEAALLWFRDSYLADLGYIYHASIDAGDERGIEQSVLSRYPITDVKNWPGLSLGGVHPDKWGGSENFRAGQPITFHRSPLRVTVEVTRTNLPAPYEVTLFVVHQKSGRDGEYWRQKEAAKTVELVAQFQKDNPDANIAVLGDFNAILSDASMRIFTDAGLISAFSPDPAAEGGKPVGSPAPEQPANRRTRRNQPDPATVTHSSGRIIDHILLTPAIAREFIAETRFVLGTPDRPEGADWRTTPPPDDWASDHYPVVIDLTPKDR